jgi:hypothetical protein
VTRAVVNRRAVAPRQTVRPGIQSGARTKNQLGDVLAVLTAKSRSRFSSGSVSLLWPVVRGQRRLLARVCWQTPRA